MNLYHDTHYFFFHILLPQMLRSEMLGPFIEASRNNEGHAMLVGFWRTAARYISGVGATGTIPAEVSMTRDNFVSAVSTPAPGWTYLVMTGPTVRGPLQVACAVAAFRDADPAGTFRYFTMEGPTDPSFPWMVGEWHADGSRSNHGAVTDISTSSAMEDFVSDVLGLRGATSASPFPATSGRGHDVIDWEAEGARAMQDALSSLREQNAQRASDGGHVTWASPASSIAAEAVTKLMHLRARGGTALVMSAPSTGGLMRETSSYVQFMWKRNGSLIVEIQADYSYWGVSIPSAEWPVLQAVGMDLPNSRSANFHQLVPKRTSPDGLQARLTGVFGAFQAVLKPAGPIETSDY